MTFVRGDRRADFVWVELEIVLDSAGDFHRYAACQEHFCLVGDEARCRDDDLIPGVQQGNHGQVERFRDAHRGDDLIFRVVRNTVQVLQVLGDGLAQFDFAPVRGVVRFSILQ
jgi:hypothetical protein